MDALFAVGVSALLALLVGQLILAGDFRVDDAYITFSFSKNLATGNGPVFSMGERVEGYSNFLWMVANAIARLFARDADPYVAARGLAFTALGFLYVVTFRMTRRYAGRFAGLFALGLLACSTDMIRAAMSGLETVPFVAAVAWGWLKYLEEPRSARRWSLLHWLPALLLRIDGFVPAVVLIGFEIVSAHVQGEFSWRKTARWIAPLAASWGAYFVWRFAYYGLPLPAPYYAKSMILVEEPLLGFDYLWAFVREYGLLASLPLMLLPLMRGPRKAAFGLWTAIIAQTAYVVHVGGDWMPFSRFFQTIVPFGAVLAGIGAKLAYDELRAFPLPMRLLARLAIPAPLAFTGIHMHSGMVDTREEAGKLVMVRHVQQHTQNVLLGSVDLLRRMVRKPGDRLVTDYAGVFALYTDAAVVDMWGLCNADIALHGNIEGIHATYGKQCPACVQRTDPDYFHVISPLVRSKDAFHDPAEVAHQVFLFATLDPVVNFAKNYAVGRVIEERTGRTLWFLERRRPRRSLAPRRPAPGIRVDYPFG